MSRLTTEQADQPDAQLAAARLATTHSAPTLEQVVKAVCEDASHDALKYALRSNVGQDGE